MASSSHWWKSSAGWSGAVSGSNGRPLDLEDPQARSCSRISSSRDRVTARRRDIRGAAARPGARFCGSGSAASASRSATPSGRRSSGPVRAGAPARSAGSSPRMRERESVGAVRGSPSSQHVNVDRARAVADAAGRAAQLAPRRLAGVQQRLRLERRSTRTQGVEKVALVEHLPTGSVSYTRGTRVRRRRWRGSATTAASSAARRSPTLEPRPEVSRPAARRSGADLGAPRHEAGASWAAASCGPTRLGSATTG